MSASTLPKATIAALQKKIIQLKKRVEQSQAQIKLLEEKQHKLEAVIESPGLLQGEILKAKFDLGETKRLISDELRQTSESNVEITKLEDKIIQGGGIEAEDLRKERAVKQSRQKIERETEEIKRIELSNIEAIKRASVARATNEAALQSLFSQVPEPESTVPRTKIGTASAAATTPTEPIPEGQEKIGYVDLFGKSRVSRKRTRDLPEEEEVIPTKPVPTKKLKNESVEIEKDIRDVQRVLVVVSAALEKQRKLFGSAVEDYNEYARLKRLPDVDRTEIGRAHV
jgi:hypothetical protein